MEDTHWQQLKDLFFQVVEIPVAERAAWMAQIDDPHLQAALARLLADDADAFSLLDAAPGNLAQRGEGVTASPKPTQHIGPYRLVRELGRGGMGTVYLAERDDEAFRHQVALKVIQQGLATDDLIRRFEQERQILASLNHPHIARLFDGGTTATGTPYFAMECIDGVPITTYCDTHQLSVDERLRLFQEACSAVQYAHQNLIVHRDLKPSNMLVTAAGRLKLLDFGIAKLLVPNQADSLQTQTGLRVMTPAYASPEQLRGAPISTASDVYALGVVLYELLTGQRPYDMAPDRDPHTRESTPPSRPSTAVTEVLDCRALSQARSTTIERLQRKLAGDLDTIVLKALRAEPERRYTSAEAFLDDIQRHLEGLPVRARQDTLGYRTHKFIQRHRVSVAIATMLVVVLVGFGVAMALQQARTARALVRAETERAKSKRVSEFLMGLFEVSNPLETSNLGEARGDTLTARALLERGLMKAEELAEEPEVQAQLLDVIGQAYWGLGRYQEAVPLLDRGLALRRRVLGQEHEDVALSLDNLARVRSANGDYALADSLHQEALKLRRKVLGSEHLDIAVSLSNLAITRSRQGRYEDAQNLHRESLALRRKLLGEEHPKVAIALSSLAGVLRRGGQYEEAETLFREALAMNRKLKGEDHPEVASSLTGLSMVLWRQSKYEEAEMLQREALAMKRRLLGEEHPHVATSLDNLALLLKEQDKYDESESLHREALAMYRRLLGEEHPNVATSLHNLAGVLSRQGKFTEAEIIQRQSLALYRRLLGEEHPHVAVSLGNLGLVFIGQGRYEEAEVLHREALAIRRKALGQEHPYVAISLSNLGTALHRQGKYKEAETLHREALALRRRLLGEEHPSVVISLSRTAEALTAQKMYAQAEPLHRQALALSQKLLGNKHWRTAHVRSGLGACLTGQARYPEAEPLLVKAYTVLEVQRGSKHFYTQEALERLITLYEAWDKPDLVARYQ